MFNKKYKGSNMMKKVLSVILTIIAAGCLFAGISFLRPTNQVSAETEAGGTPVFSATTKYMTATEGDYMLLATGIKNYGDCYECGYVIQGLEAVTYSVGKFYSAISVGGTTWTADELFSGFTGMVIWEVKSHGEEVACTPYAVVGEREDGNLYPAEDKAAATVYGNKKIIAGHTAPATFEARKASTFSITQVATQVATDKTIAIDFKFDDSSDNDTNFNFGLRQTSSSDTNAIYWLRAIKGTPMKMNIANGGVKDGSAEKPFPDGYSFISMSGGWTRFVIDLSKAIENNCGELHGTVSYITEIVINSWGTGSGEYKYMGVVNTLSVENGKGEGSYLQGTTAVLTADADESKTFAGWRENGNIVSNSQLYTFTVNNDVDISAVYNANNYLECELDNWASYRTVSFLFKKKKSDDTGRIEVRLCDSTKTALGYVVTVTLTESNATVSNTWGGNPRIETVGDWYKLSIEPDSLKKQNDRDGTETMEYLWIKTVETANPVDIKDIQVVDYKAINNKYYDLPDTISSYKTSNKYITFKVKKVNDSGSSVVLMKLSNGSADSYGIRFTFVANAAPTVTGGNNRGCASIEDIGGGWYLITTQTGAQIGGDSAFDATKLLIISYSGWTDFYIKDIEVH